MVSSEAGSRRRKPPEERRAEIVEVAARIALQEGLERITLRAVADRLGVRPGLISHYFPVADELVVEAFVLAITGERERLFSTRGAPLERLAGFVHRVERIDARALSALWLNARHLSRFLPLLAESIESQEALDRDWLTSLLRDGQAAGDFVTSDPFGACVRIFVAVDGFGAYVNNLGSFEHPMFQHYVADVCVWTLGLSAEGFRAQIDAQSGVGAGEGATVGDPA